jgi:hypothetical protein
VRLDFVVAEFQLPTLVIERHELVRRIPLLVEQRREQRRGPEAFGWSW